MSTFETLARELATRVDLGNQATPFLRMLMAHMTNPDKGGLPGFVQSLRSAGWNTLDSWLGRADLATNATEEQATKFIVSEAVVIISFFAFDYYLWFYN